MTTETVSMTTDEFVSTQVCVVGWMQKVVQEADSNGANVRVTRIATPFGTFVTGMEVDPT